MNLRKLHSNLEEIDGWRDFEPETIRDLDLGPEMDEKLFNKIMALQTCFNAFEDDEGFYFNDFRMFEKITLAFNDVIPDFTEIEHAEPHEIQVTINFLEEIDSVDFDEEVVNYIVASYNYANILYCPFIEKVNNNLEDNKLKSKIASFWNKLPKDQDTINKIAETEDSIVSNQIKKLLYVKRYAEVFLEIEGVD
jgi:hypothetical protein